MRTSILLCFLFVGCRTAQAPETAPEAAPVVEPAPILAPEERLDGIKSALAEVTAELNEKGDYNCCVQPVCTWCALYEASCACFSNLQEGSEVCPGCGLGWHNDEGVVDGVDKSQVKWNITHEHPAAGGHAH